MKDISKRRKIREIKKYKEKNLLKKNKRLSELRRKIWREDEQEYIELDKPIKWGYKKYFILRDDIKNRKDANFFEKILEKINDFVYCKEKTFLKKDYHTKKKKPILHELQALSHRDFVKLEEKEKELFKSKLIKRELKFFFIYDWMFIPKISPHYLTHIKVIKSDLHKEKTEIEEFINDRNLIYKIDKILGYSVNKYSKEKERAKIKKGVQNTIKKEI
ncbi:MAG: hypothetical protein U0457_13140 [Candidatus Sericytochromatia bacterium]